MSTIRDSGRPLDSLGITVEGVNGKAATGPQGWPDSSAFHDKDTIWPAMMARIGRRTGLWPHLEFLVTQQGRAAAPLLSGTCRLLTKPP
jgi:hypothetical protein